MVFHAVLLLVNPILVFYISADVVVVLYCVAVADSLRVTVSVSGPVGVSVP